MNSQSISFHALLMLEGSMTEQKNFATIVSISSNFHVCYYFPINSSCVLCHEISRHVTRVYCVDTLHCCRRWQMFGMSSQSLWRPLGITATWCGEPEIMVYHQTDISTPLHPPTILIYCRKYLQQDQYWLVNGLELPFNVTSFHSQLFTDVAIRNSTVMYTIKLKQSAWSNSELPCIEQAAYISLGNTGYNQNWIL